MPVVISVSKESIIGSSFCSIYDLFNSLPFPDVFGVNFID